ncbi:MAG: aminomethyl-transferring glycine dehydrogenase subunit GcvPB [Nitrospinae bacterium]|nr:aminomethyl-transferring glycine dehydrogenase subunit GcvPB [Nitrospinota bacterium]
MFQEEKLIFEKSVKGRKGVHLSFNENKLNTVKPSIPDAFLRNNAAELPEVSETDVVRHFHRLSHWNYSIDEGFYPLGSCTMKYNPRINEILSGLSGFGNSHPSFPEEISQGSLEVFYNLSEALKQITGFPACSLQPAAGAHGEFTGLLLIKKYHEIKGNTKKNKIIIPDSAHGTNPSSCTIAGFETVPLASGEDGRVHIEDLRKTINEETAGIMLTNPNTVGLFEKDIKVIADLIHQYDGLVYCDGANFNAIIGQYSPAKMGIDVMHLNLHKTFSTPHGGGGPGAGPILVSDKLSPYLPVPEICFNNGIYSLDYSNEQSIGKIKHYFGNFGVLLRAYAYILSLGDKYIASISKLSVLNANYCQARLKEHFDIPFVSTFCMHETILSDSRQNEQGSTTLNMAKALIDKGYHPPTIYFPLIVKGAMMIEPTETESKETLDEFIDALIAIAEEIKQGESFASAPQKVKVTRLDEATAARKPILKFEEENE